MTRKTVILSVDADRADGLIDALGKRDYISIISLDREARKRLRDCPCCKKRLSQERLYTIDEKMMTPMLSLIQKMSIAKTVILTNRDNPIKSIPPVEHDRCVEFDHKLMGKAKSLGLIKSFIDGSRETYFTDALSFFLDEATHSPSYMITLDGEVIETGGSMFFDEIKFKKEDTKDRFKREFREAIAAIPQSTITFVENGQMSLV